MYDYDFGFFDSASVVACSGTINATAEIIDVGAGLIEGVAVIDVTTIEIASDDELYSICIQGSNSSTFASTIVDLATLELGAYQVLNYSDVDSTIGRYNLPVRNELNGTKYRYLRLICDVAGTIDTTGITFSARLQKHAG
jgi:hypothetical protein